MKIYKTKEIYIFLIIIYDNILDIIGSMLYIITLLYHSFEI